MVWGGAAYEELFVECDFGTGCEEGDRRRGIGLFCLAIGAWLLRVRRRLVA
jgi:hypothetical protein